MPAERITFSIENDFPNSKINSEKFDSEVRASSISGQFNGVMADENNCDVWFSVEQSPANVVILGALVAAHDGEVGDDRTKEEILRDIFNNVTSAEQVGRLINALDAFPSFEVMLGQKRYDLARQRVAAGLTAEVIIQDDYDLIDQQLPGYVAP